MNVYAEFVESIVKGMTIDQIIAYKPSEEAQERVSQLLSALKDDTITPDERAELMHHTELEQIVLMAKAKARQHVQKR